MSETTQQIEELASPFSHVLQTNYIPTDSECATIRQFLEAPKARLNEILAEMRRLQALFKTLAAKKDRLKKFVDVHSALVSPMRRMPPELLQNIFLQTLPQSRNCAITDKEGPLLLSSVCKSWRALVLATPRLWTSVHIVVPPSSHIDAFSAWLKRVWLPRSGIQPLSFSVAHSTSLLTPDSVSLRLVYDLLVNDAHRWRHVELALHSISDIEYVSTALSGTSLPNLQSLKLSPPLRQLFMPQPPTGDMLAFLDNAPNIQRLWLPDLQLLYTTRSLSSTVLSTVVDLKIEATRLSRGLDYVHLWETLRHCTVLERCQIVSNPQEDAAVDPPEPFSLPSLHTLAITHGRAPTTTMNFFAFLDLPNLRTLTCETHGPWLTIGVAELVDLLPSPSSLLRVETLTLGINLMETQKLLTALVLFPALTKLILKHEPKGTITDTGLFGTNLILGSEAPSGDGTFLNKLGEGLLGDETTDPPRGRLLPSLQHISLGDLEATSDEALVAFVRASAARQMRKIECSFARPRQRDVTPDLKNIIRDLVPPMQVQLRYSKRGVMSGYSPFTGLRDANTHRTGG
ncbi:F-box domain-containing protein [Mycena indigotica]|uniref:F-box domain-containing protein n=1 Tax=Mycena indigotica TaxID=2126181 RepID=A0A8H6RXY1_9AGAR|nr:F-box domain-containing protein [Mycena indigotica]KAF7288922.1 F-box domain-containing protein [Mycena indigotica]